MDYDPFKIINDVIILKLKSSLVFSQNKVHSISLPVKRTWGGDELLQDCRISGWGSTRSNTNSFSKILQWAKVPTIPNCNSVSLMIR